MKTLKNVTVKMMGLLLMTTLSFSAMGQSSKTIDLRSDRDNHKFRLYTSPLSMINPLGGSVQLTAGKSLWKGGEVQLNYSTRLKNGNPFRACNFALLYLIGLDAHYSKGHKVGVEVQQTFARTSNTDFYLSAEFATSKEDITITGVYLLGYHVGGEDDTYTINRSFANMKMGMKCFINSRFIIDSYIGFGRKFGDTIFGSLEEEDDDLLFVNIAIPVGIKIGYQF